jgi:hypothetical protein
MFQSKLLKTAASNAVLNEAKQRYGKNPEFPQTDEELKALGEAVDKIIPKEAQTNSKGKMFYLWVFKQLYGPQKSFILGEDDFRVGPILQNAWNAIKKNMLVGAAANLDSYPDINALEEAIDKLLDKKKGEDLDDDVYSEEEWKEINAGATKIYDQGGWQLWKVKKSSSQTVLRAANLLCDNSKNGVKWCVGWAWPDRSLARNYIPNGDFFVFRSGNRSRYAVNTTGSELNIWNPEDKPVFSSNRSTGVRTSAVPSLEAAAKELGIKSIPSTSAIPKEIIPIIKAVYDQEPALQLIPADTLVEFNKENQTIFNKLVYQADPKQMVKDLNSLLQSYNSVIQGYTILSTAASPAVQKDFGDAVQEMNQNCVIGYIEALASYNNTRLPEPLEAMLQGVVQDWEKEVESGRL